MPIRLRLAVWSGTILAVGLLVFSTMIYLIAGRTLNAQADTVIEGRAERIAALLAGLDVRSPAALAHTTLVFTSPGVSIALLGRDGQVLAHSPGTILPPPPCLPTCKGSTNRAAKYPRASAMFTALPRDIFYNQHVTGEPFRIYALRAAGVAPVVYVLVGHSVQDIANTLDTLLILLVAGSVLCLAIVSAASWLLARGALTPIANLTKTAAAIAESGDLVERVQAPARRDEVGQLAATFNAMLEKLSTLHAAQRRFIADASHELRAPLTTIRGNVELLLLAPDTPPADREDALRETAAEAARLTRMVNGLLALARGDSDQPPRVEPVHVDEILRDACRFAAQRPRAARIVLGRCDPAIVLANADRLEQLLIILLDNAIKYTPSTGSITCSLINAPPWTVLTIQDTGIGIDAADLPRIFERFYRAERARAYEQSAEDRAGDGAPRPEGAGLGLAIACQIAEEAGGSIAASSSPGEGATFTVHLPLLVAAR